MGDLQKDMDRRAAKSGSLPRDLIPLWHYPQGTVPPVLCSGPQVLSKRLQCDL